jgi:hypothetical protein
MKPQKLTGLTSKEFLDDVRSAPFLKRQALLFDQIAIIDLPFLIETLSHQSNDQSRQYGAELEWLMTQGIIYEPDYPKTTWGGLEELFEKLTADTRCDKKMISLVQQTLKDEITCLEDLRNSIDLMLRTGSFENSNTERFTRNLHLQIANASQVRHAAYWLSAVKGNRTVLAHSLPDYDLCSTSVERKALVWEVVLAHVPVLQEDTSWEKIVEFRTDPDSRRRLNDLVHWVHSLASSAKSRDDVQEELSCLRSRYEHAFKLHKLEYRLGVFEAVMEPMLAAAENFVKLNWSKVGEPFLKLKKHSIELQKAEESIPGREISYLVKMQETFE